MVHADVSGVAFTVNPLTGAEDEIVINAARGLGEALVSGAIDPDEYIVRKGSGELLLRAPRRQTATNGAAALSDEDDCRAGGAPARRSKRTTARRRTWSGAATKPGSGSCSRGRSPRRSRRGALDIEWTRANFAEVLPDLTSPQALAAFEELLNAAERLNLGRPDRRPKRSSGRW